MQKYKLSKWTFIVLATCCLTACGSSSTLSPTPQTNATPIHETSTLLAPTSVPTLKVLATAPPTLTLEPTLASTLTRTPTAKPTLTATRKPTLTATRKPTLTATRKPTLTPSLVPLSGVATIFDGYKKYRTSGFQFSSAKVVAWDSNKSDILGAGDPIGFFFQFDTPPYNNPKLDKDARSGGLAMRARSLEEITECPEKGYAFHFVPAKADTAYCIRTRDGKHYAKILITAIGNGQIVFQWVYQPALTNRFDK